MNQNVVALFDGKALHPKEILNLQHNQYYILSIEPIGQAVEADSAFDISALAVKTGISDLATAHDFYLYGKPKRKAGNKKNVK